MAYSSREARLELLEDIARAAERIGVALAALGLAYEQLDEASGDRLEEQLFRPVQVAYGRAQRTYTGFAERYGLPASGLAAAPEAGVGHGAREAIDRASDALAEADETLSDLQDSMRPVEVGDAELRAGLADVREHLAELPTAAREIVRVLGR
jgi:hypothetical protein